MCYTISKNTVQARASITLRHEIMSTCMCHSRGFSYQVLAVLQYLRKNADNALNHNKVPNLHLDNGSRRVMAANVTQLLLQIVL